MAVPVFQTMLVFPNDVDAVVFRPRVRNDVFDAGIRLIEDALHRLFQELRLVVRRCDDGDQWPAFGHGIGAIVRRTSRGATIAAASAQPPRRAWATAGHKGRS